jgi:hypothetical protein
MPNTTIPGTALITTGIVTVCCGLHKRGDWGTCCAISDCTPCCERCPNCPYLALPAMFAADWLGLRDLGALIDSILREIP